ncbi:hypothetical protein SAMN05421863_101483 [Nitrosomonas communis]|uniref:Uncharacterized protein n=1 Tax=Nitrosomonas communis TaxID=44574 RepID=A0A1I4NFX6_9PROT|nr:hypothetical protein SAMN05421863_101483 [Nitrosomonas communis]
MNLLEPHFPQQVTLRFLITGVIHKFINSPHSVHTLFHVRPLKFLSYGLEVIGRNRL